MAAKFTKRDNLGKIFEEFPKLPDLKQVTFPDDKEKSQSRKEKQDDCFSTTPIQCASNWSYFSLHLLAWILRPFQLKNIIFPYQKERLKPFRQVKGRQANI